MSSSPVIHLSEWRLIVCRKCQHAIWPAQLQSHLQGPHHRMKIKEAEPIVKTTQSWPNLIEYPIELNIPTQVNSAIPHLAIHHDGLLCDIQPERCQYICRSEKFMKTHCKQKHDWSMQSRKGRPGKSTSGSVTKSWKTVVCQRFFNHQHGSQYFQVINHEIVENEIVGANVENQVRQVIDRAMIAVRQKEREVIDQGEDLEVNRWLDRTRWLQYLVGLERSTLMALIARPDSENEPVINEIWASFDRMIRHCQQTIMSHVGIFVRMEAVRKDNSSQEYTPLQAYMNAQSIGDHSRPWKQVLMFFARARPQGSETSPRYRFNSAQKRAWKEFCAAIERQSEEEEESEEIESTSSEVESPDVEEVDRCREKPVKMRPVDRLCLEFCIALLDQRALRDEYDSALVRALAVLGADESGWLGADRYPPILSRMIKLARMMVVQQAWNHSSEKERVEMPRFPSQVQELLNDDSDRESDDVSVSDDQASIPEESGCLVRVRDMMNRFMIRGSHSPMQWMLDLRTYGLKIHYNTTSAGHIDWIGDQIVYKNLQFSMRQFRSMIHGLVTETRRIMMEDLLFVPQLGAVPAIQWDALRDNPSDNTPGWSFMQDERHEWAVNGDWWLFNRAWEHEEVKRRFVRPRAEMSWHREGIESYMGRVVEFREKLLALMHISGGQPGRGPEILSCRHRNTARGGARNIFVEQGLMVYVTRYHKGYAIQGDVKVIHRYLPREVGELLVYYIWLILPFQEKLEVTVWEKDRVSAFMWPADPNGKKFTSQRLRTILQRESRIGMSVQLNIQSYREVAIGISRKYMRQGLSFEPDTKEKESEMAEKEEDDIADLQAGHGSHVAGMIYARDIMEVRGEIASKRQRFRESSQEWHRFIGFASAINAPPTSQNKRKAP